MDRMIAKLVGLVIGVVVLGAVAVAFFGVVATVAAVYGVYRGGRALWSCHTRRVAQVRHQRAELLARAEIQHRWWLEGDPRGTYGRHTPAGLTG